MRLLIVEDDPSVRIALDRALRGAGHETATATSGDRALEMVAAGRHDALVLDLGLPVMDGLEVARRIRAAGNNVPILMLTARTTVADRVAGLDAGADDYLVKPFALDELLARIRVFERRAPAPGGPRGVLTFEDLSLDQDAHECRRGGRKIELTRTEFRLLEFLIENPLRVLSRHGIVEHVWGYDFGPDSNSLEVYVGYLRRKLEAGGESRILQTVRGAGYVLRS